MSSSTRVECTPNASSSRESQTSGALQSRVYIHMYMCVCVYIYICICIYIYVLEHSS